MKKKMFSIVKILLICLVVFVAIKWIIAVPVQRHYGYKKLYKYMEVQGIKKDNIKEIKAIKDYIKGNQVYRVQIKDPADFTLVYIYDDYPNPGKMELSSIEFQSKDDFKSLSSEEMQKFKYPPLDDDWETKTISHN
ncbi:DUF3139 domain-containing protein [Finegoldia magna]|uniref:DUF3139 domain-containing protein n=1 Tax=Finegoldia TaxID=150022 RepID=UPI0012B1144F|nr:DUF3139 domain-containing protein [Finegoldia magna]MDU7032837.1 DUF3139 domain-containing protein [Finegoldia magna]MDU7140649.1 DUF3139 domain-containing protein [Finegoldia magna]MSB16581.1 DUF3139 domain-containing protein [Finegoldia magna]MSD45368.1 DUF3139 domain-containing protein [Finegoldia magna]